MAGKNYGIKNSKCGNPFPKLVFDKHVCFGEIEEVYKVTLPPPTQSVPQNSVKDSTISSDSDSDSEYGYDSDTDTATDAYGCSLIDASTFISDEEIEKKTHAGWMALALRLRKRILDTYPVNGCIYILHANQFRFNNLRYFYHKQQTESLTVEKLYEALRQNDGCDNYLFVYDYIGFVLLVHLALGEPIPRNRITNDTLTEFHVNMVKCWGIPRRNGVDIVMPGDRKTLVPRKTVNN